MNYLFFDTECATCDHGAKICEFGYVLTDKYLNVIKREDLLINPQVKFNFYQLKRAGIELSYPAETYYSSPTLKERYAAIRSLLTDPEVLPIGFSCDNDARFFLSDFRRNSLEIFDYRYLDVILLFKEGLKREKGLSLDVIYKEAGGEDIAHHQAENDSFMTLTALKYYMKESGEDLETLLKHEYAFGEVFCGKIVIGGRPFNYNSNGKLTKLNKKLLTEFIEDKPVSEGALSGKKFCFEKNFEKDEVFTLLKAIDKAADMGGRYTFVLSEADYLVYKEKSNRKYLFKKKKRACRVIDFTEFCKMLQVPEDDFLPENIDVNAMIGNLEKHKDWFSKYVNKH